MAEQKTQSRRLDKAFSKKPLTRRLLTVVVIVAVIASIVAYIFWRRVQTSTDDSLVDLTTHTVRRGDLVVAVTESGDIKALNSTDIKSEVEGRTTIISIVDEGTIITPQEVNDGKILAELDSSEIKLKLNQQEVAFSNAEAGYAEAQESLEIQKKQNESDIQSGRLKVRFALMDFKKYLGEVLAGRAIDDSNSLNPGLGDITGMLDDEQLGGEALQKLKELKNEIDLAQSKLERASDKLDWTRKLYDANYVAETELRADELEVDSLKAQSEKAKIELHLFRLYEFPKQTEKLLSDYYESLRELDRIQASARSKLAQELAKLKNKEATYNLQKEQLEKLKKQLAACIIRAPVPGQVVYGSSLLDRWQRQSQMIEVGAEVRERQKIISIPDTSQMKVDIKVHETWIGKIHPNQPATITVSAFPDKSFEGKVLKKAPLADPENWLNPDLKVYSTDVAIEGAHDFIKTGMSAKVEIIIQRLKDVLTVPLQSVITSEGQKFCYVLNNEKRVKRAVELGSFNADFVEIKSGLTEGEKVLLNPPRFEQPPQKQAL